MTGRFIWLVVWEACDRGSRWFILWEAWGWKVYSVNCVGGGLVAEGLIEWLCGRLVLGRFILSVKWEACDWKIYSVSWMGVLWLRVSLVDCVVGLGLEV